MGRGADNITGTTRPLADLCRADPETSGIRVERKTTATDAAAFCANVGGSLPTPGSVEEALGQAKAFATSLEKTEGDCWNLGAAKMLLGQV